MSESFYLQKLLLLSVLLFSALSDILNSKIPNRIIICGFLISTVMKFFYPAEKDACTLFVMTLFIIILLLAWTKGKVGAGDIKLFALIVYTIPDAEGFEIAEYAVITAAIWGIVIMIKEKSLRPEKKLPLAACTFIGAVAQMII